MLFRWNLSLDKILFGQQQPFKWPAIRRNVSRYNGLFAYHSTTIPDIIGIWCVCMCVSGVFGNFRLFAFACRPLVVTVLPQKWDLALLLHTLAHAYCLHFRHRTKVYIIFVHRVCLDGCASRATMRCLRCRHNSWFSIKRHCFVAVSVNTCFNR